MQGEVLSEGPWELGGALSGEGHSRLYFCHAVRGRLPPLESAVFSAPPGIVLRPWSPGSVLFARLEMLLTF